MDPMCVLKTLIFSVVLQITDYRSTMCQRRTSSPSITSKNTFRQHIKMDRFKVFCYSILHEESDGRKGQYKKGGGGQFQRVNEILRKE